MLWLMQRFGRRATSLPGKMALRISPRLFARLARQLNFCAVVTGTNGKTTTTAMLSRMFAAGEPVIHNAEGANMQQGILTALLRAASWTGRLRVRTAVFEVDEATLPVVAPYLPIRVAVVTNLFRDQLDRYGELDTTVRKVTEGLARTAASLVLNGDDPLVRHVGLSLGTHHVVYFGMHRGHLHPLEREVMRDGAFCLRCGHPLRYDGFFYGQLGQYACTHCDFVQPHPTFCGQYEPGRLHVHQEGLPGMSFPLPTRGLFNAYNALAAVAAARVSGLSAGQIERGLQSFVPPLGRMQPFATTPVSVLNLIKNPAGCDSVLAAIAAEPGDKGFCILINDLAADGRDVSWLWDADFEWLPDRIQPAFCVAGGLRAEDMAVRLKYAGLPAAAIVPVPGIEPAIDAALDRAAARGVSLYVLATYTALYPAARHLTRRADTTSGTASWDAGRKNDETHPDSPPVSRSPESVRG
ncbi:Mur ligase family protein [Alicyclobacillus cellulosilyticus]|uniref:Mur ligase family protein n=1 Tax=Alicyclobacillus cellulosilyticus TaxID=1003997 RepID=UPI001E5558F9|nr:Mur ligase family protein [Alicyclobacillus cellulosilyticus]